MSIIPSIYNTIKKEVYNTAAFMNSAISDKIQRNEWVIFVNGNSQIGLGAIGEVRGRTESVTFTNS